MSESHKKEPQLKNNTRTKSESMMGNKNAIGIIPWNKDKSCSNISNSLKNYYLNNPNAKLKISNFMKNRKPIIKNGTELNNILIMKQNGLSNHEIAKILNCSERTIRNRMAGR